MFMKQLGIKDVVLYSGEIGCRNAVNMADKPLTRKADLGAVIEKFKITS